MVEVVNIGTAAKQRGGKNTLKKIENYVHWIYSTKQRWKDMTWVWINVARLWMSHVMSLIPLKQRMSVLKNQSKMELLSVFVILCPYPVICVMVPWTPLELLSTLLRMCGYWITCCSLFHWSYSDTVMVVFKIIWDFLNFVPLGTCWVTVDNLRTPASLVCLAILVVTWFWTVCIELWRCDGKHNNYSLRTKKRRWTSSYLSNLK